MLLSLLVCVSHHMCGLLGVGRREGGFMEGPPPRPSIAEAATRPRLFTRALEHACGCLWMVGKEGPLARLGADDARSTKVLERQ